MATAEEPRRRARFTRTERAIHWVHAVAFVVLLLSGLCLYLPALAELSVALLLVAVAGNRRALRATLREVEAFDADDCAWFRDRSTPAGRLNAGQKLNTAATAAFALVFTVTGVLLWLGEYDMRFRFANTLLIHDWLMYMSVLLFAGHLYLSPVNPSTRHSLNAITRGWVERGSGPPASRQVGRRYALAPING